MTVTEAFEVMDLCEYGGGDGPFHLMGEAVATIKSAAGRLNRIQTDPLSQQIVLNGLHRYAALTPRERGAQGDAIAALTVQLLTNDPT